MKKIAPSILSADFSDLLSDVKKIEAGGADYIHVDIMDGHFVPNISFGAMVMKSLNGKTQLKYDVHLMIENPDQYINDFVTEQTEYITVHQEACRHLNRTIQAIKATGVKAGVSINPATSLDTLDWVLDDVDLVLIMSVNPGFGGQKFISSSLEKIRNLSKIREDRNLHFAIEVDGGVTESNCIDLYEAGADVLVAGSAVFGAKDISKAIENLKKTK